MSHPFEEPVRRLYAAFAAGDVDAIKAVFDPQVVWHNPGDNPTTGEHRGVEAVLAFFGVVAQVSEGTFTADLDDVLANDRHALSLHTGRAHSRGKTLDERNVLVFHIADGRISEVWEHHENTAVADAFWN
jgi:ketosteroid isomerase-like protein